MSEGHRSGDTSEERRGIRRRSRLNGRQKAKEILYNTKSQCQKLGLERGIPFHLQLVIHNFLTSIEQEHLSRPKLPIRTQFSRSSNSNSTGSPHLHLLKRLFLHLQRRKIPIHGSFCELLPRDSRIFPLWSLDDRISARLIKERHTITFPKIILSNHSRRLDSMEGTLKPIITPTHEQVADIANDFAGAGLDFRPGIPDPKFGGRFATGTDFESGLAGALEEEGYEIPIYVCAGSIVSFWDGHGGIDFEIMEEA
jgi:hypothetical protein